MAASDAVAKALEEVHLAKTKELKGVSANDVLDVFFISNSRRPKRETLSLRLRRNTRKNGKKIAFSSQMRQVSPRYPSIRNHPTRLERNIPSSLVRWLSRT
jgi:hypothetical protein